MQRNFCSFTSLSRSLSIPKIMMDVTCVTTFLLPMSTENFAENSLPPSPRPNLIPFSPLSRPPTPNPNSTARVHSNPSQPPLNHSKPAQSPLNRANRAQPAPRSHLPTHGGTSRLRNGPQANSDRSVCRAISHGKASSEWLLHFPVCHFN